MDGDRAIAAARVTLRRAADGDGDALEDVATSLDAVRILVPLRGADDGPAPPADLPATCPTSWPALVGPARSESVLPAFTGWDTLSAFRSRTRAVGVELDAALHLARRCGVDAVVIDPGADHAVLLAATDRPVEVPAAPAYWSAHHPVRALAGPLHPSDLATLRRASSAADIERAWAVELVDPNGLPHLVVAIEPVGPLPTVVPALAEALRDQLLHPDHVRVDVLALTDPTLHAEVTRLDRPIYPSSRREQGRLVAARPIRPLV